MRRLLPAISLISAAAIGYEILLMRLLSIIQWHHFAYMIISLALLGYAASGACIAVFRQRLQARFEAAFAACALSFAAAMPVCFFAAQQVPFNALEIVWDPTQWAYLGALYLLFFVPFFFAASAIGLVFTCWPGRPGRVYFFDLLGAGTGAAFIIAVLFAVSPQMALYVLSGLPLVASLLVGAGGVLRRSAYIGAAVYLVLGMSASLLGWPALEVSDYKGLSQALQVVGARRVEEKSSPLGLLTLVASPAVPLHHAPGLSLGAAHTPPEQLAVFTDGDAISAISPADSDLAYLGDLASSLPYRLLKRPTVLVLGAGGGDDVLLALHHDAAHVDAVELDRHMIQLAAGAFRSSSASVYADPRVDVHFGEARGYVSRTDARYDLIHIGLLDSFGASGAGVQSLHESYLYTVEGLARYMDSLASGGMLSITRWLKLPPRDSLKLFATAVDALDARGVEAPGRQLAMIRSWNTTTLLIRNGPFGAGDVEAIRDFARSRSFDTVYYPGMPAAEANRFNQLEQPYLHEAAVALLGDQRPAFIERYKYALEPATDDRPYFFHFFRWNSLAEILALRERGGAGLIEWGYLVLVATLVQAALVGAVIILLPLVSLERAWSPGIGVRMGAYFFVLGLAFLFVEIAFIQRFILFLSHPLYAVAVVLAGFLLFAGLGSAWSARLRLNPVLVAVPAIWGLSLVYLFGLPALFEQFIGLADTARVVLAIALIAPLAFFMGMPFPAGLSRLRDVAPGYIPWAWGINGYASVLSAVLATLLAIQVGFSGVLILALVLYAAAAALARGW
ncbi:MAG TPA: spermidine synthase [Woeseiaceae bacterium]|nr:spermidine synthase [Woeseiaceae bacterium]